MEGNELILDMSSLSEEPRQKIDLIKHGSAPTPETVTGIQSESGGNFSSPAPSMPQVSLEQYSPITPMPDTSGLTEKEWALIDDFSKKIDIRDTGQIMSYGSSAQKSTAAFSGSVLSNVAAKDLAEIGGMLTGLVGDLKNFSPDSVKKSGFFRKAANTVSAMRQKYQSVEQHIDQISVNLEGHRHMLMKDIALLDQLYAKNIEYLKEITFYIIAGKKKLEQTENTDLVNLREKARKSGRMEDVQEANALADLCNRFDKKLYDLELTRMISLQMGPQIRMIQSADLTLSEKIQSTIVNTIPLWKNQIVLTLGIVHTQNAVRAQRQVTDMTNNLLRRNAEMLKMGVVETARESERGIVDVETLKSTNQTLISTIEEVTRIQNEGRQKRRDAEKEIAQIEQEMKTKLLELNSNKNNLIE